MASQTRCFQSLFSLTWMTVEASARLSCSELCPSLFSSVVSKVLVQCNEISWFLSILENGNGSALTKNERML